WSIIGHLDHAARHHLSVRYNFIQQLGESLRHVLARELTQPFSISAGNILPSDPLNEVDQGLHYFRSVSRWRDSMWHTAFAEDRCGVAVRFAQSAERTGGREIVVPARIGPASR